MPNPFEIKAQVYGAIEYKEKIRQIQNDLHGRDFAQSMMDASMVVSRDAKINAPVDMGILKSSITPDVRQNLTTTEGVIGSNLKHAPFMELGTGIYAGNPRVKFPPPSALEGWAHRHGTTGFAVAMAIYKAGGLKPRKYLQRALDENRDRIIKILEDGVARIVSK